jgi:ABC-type transport system involved in multi-copper enzyme maturation permease subunit
VGAGIGRVAAVASNTFRETVRERVLYNLVIFAILMTLSGLLLSQLSIRQDEKIIKDVGLASMDVFGNLIAIFIGVGLVGKEIERRSLFPLLAKPLSREELFLGKFLGLSFTLFVNLGVMCLGMLLTLFATSRHADPALLKAAYGILLGLLLVVAVALFFSTLTSSTLAALCTFSVPRWLVDTLYYSVPNFRNFDFKDAVVYGDPVPISVLGWTTLYAGVYVALLLWLGALIFRRREFY